MSAGCLKRQLLSKTVFLNWLSDNHFDLYAQPHTSTLHTRQKAGILGWISPRGWFCPLNTTWDSAAGTARSWAVQEVTFLPPAIDFCTSFWGAYTQTCVTHTHIHTKALHTKTLLPESQSSGSALVEACGLFAQGCFGTNDELDGCSESFNSRLSTGRIQSCRDEEKTEINPV